MINTSEIHGPARCWTEYDPTIIGFIRAILYQLRLSHWASPIPGVSEIGHETRIWATICYQSIRSVHYHNYRSHLNTWQSGHITVLLCSCPYMAMLPSQVTLLLNKSIYGAYSGSRDHHSMTWYRITHIWACWSLDWVHLTTWSVTWSH